jgi:hypothetical protein
VKLDAATFAFDDLQVLTRQPCRFLRNLKRFVLGVKPNPHLVSNRAFILARPEFGGNVDLNS